jgi:hypothetical protein
MVEIDVTCHLESFRRFLVNSTCRSFIPESYLRDPEVFPEKESEPGSIYIEAADKVTLKKIRDISFVNANEILGIIYTSKSGHSKLKWRQQSGPMGRVTGDASNNSLVNLSMARIITPEYVEELIGRSEEGGEGSGAPAESQPSIEVAAEAQATTTAAAGGAESTAATTVTTAPSPEPEEKTPSSGQVEGTTSSSPAEASATTLRPDEVAESMKPAFPPDEEEDDFEAADADEEEQEELDEQEREEMA